MENTAENVFEEKEITSQNPKLQIVKSKNQIDFFMRNYAVYKKSGVVVMEVIFSTPSGDASRYYELTKEELRKTSSALLRMKSGKILSSSAAASFCNWVCFIFNPGGFALIEQEPLYNLHWISEDFYSLIPR